MKKSFLQTILFYSVMFVGFLLIDLTMDHLIDKNSPFNLGSILFAGSVVMVSFILLERARKTHERTEDVLRESRDQLEERVVERTRELQIVNRSLEEEATERQRVEAELRESEEKYRTHFDFFPEPATVWNREGVLLMQNLVSAKNLGGQRDDFLGKTIFDLFGEAAAGYLERMVRVIESGDTEYQEDVVELASGKRYFWTIMQQIKKPNGSFAVQIVSYDITQRKQIEEELSASEEKFATVFQFSPDAIAIVRTKDGVLLDVNRSFTTQFGYSRSDVIEKNWAGLELFQNGVDQNWLRNLFHDEKVVNNIELDTRRLDGESATMLLSLTTIVVNGEDCVLAITHDISERKRAERELSRVQAELAMGIKERSAMEERQRLARELHDSVSQALYGISLGAHTALTMLDSDRHKVIEALDYVISLTRNGLAEMRALIFELRPESLEKEGLVNALIKQTEALRGRYDIEVDVSICEEPDVSLQVKEAIYRIAQEALHNAVKHAYPSRLALSMTCDGSNLILIISDDGMGFDPTLEYSGHLGLHSMHERAEGVGGRLEIFSKAKAGAQIRAYIPLDGKGSRN